MMKEPQLIADISRRVATIEGQLKGIERLLQKEDLLQTLTQAAAVRNALASLVTVLLQASVTHRFAMISLHEQPEDVFERTLERAMVYWFSSNNHGLQPADAAEDEADFWPAARSYTRAIQDRVRSIGMVLEGQDYLRGLRELGAMHREIDDLVRLALRRFIKDRTAGRKGGRAERNAFGRAVEEAFKYWRLPDPRVVAPTITGSGKTILVVDDDPDVVDYLRYVLEKRAYAVVTAGDAAEAMSKVETEKPDLIILDIMMPKGTEGFHFTWRLRARPEQEYRRIPIIVLTAIHDTTSLRFYPEARDGEYGPGEFLPVEAFLDKPVAEEELLQNVERVLSIAAHGTR